MLFILSIININSDFVGIIIIIEDILIISMIIFVGDVLMNLLIFVMILMFELELIIKNVNIIDDNLFILSMNMIGVLIIIII